MHVAAVPVVLCEHPHAILKFQQMLPLAVVDWLQRLLIAVAREWSKALCLLVELVQFNSIKSCRYILG